MHQRRGGEGGRPTDTCCFPFFFSFSSMHAIPLLSSWGWSFFSSAVNTKTVCIQVMKSSVSFAPEYNWALLYHKHRNGKKIRKNLIDKSILSSFLLIRPGYVCYEPFMICLHEMLWLQSSTYGQSYSLDKTLLTRRNKEKLALGLVTRKFRRMGQVLG